MLCRCLLALALSCVGATGIAREWPRFEYPEGSTPLTHYARAATLADVDGDGLQDVFLRGENTLTLLRAKGDGTFYPEQIIRPPSARAYVGFAAADFNKDGFLDFAVVVRPTSYSSEIELYSGQSDGSFSAPAIIPIPIVGTGIAADDFDGDGKIDLAVAGFPKSIQPSPYPNVAICYGNGDGTFETPSTFLISKRGGTESSSLQSLVTADWNNDHKPDLAFTDGTYIVLIQNLGNRQFGQPQYYGDAPPPGQNNRLSRSYVSVLPDLNGDGYVDFASPDPNTRSLTIVFTGVGYQSVDIGTTSAKDTVAADFDLDGKLDLMVNVGDPSPPTHRYLCFISQSATGSYIKTNAFSPYTLGEGLVTADFNQDGRPDLGFTSNTLRLPYSFGELINFRGSGSFLNLSQRELKASERDGMVNATVIRTGDLSAAIKVAYIARPGTAGEADVAQSGSVEFAPGQSRAPLKVPIYRDNLYEGPENFTLTLLDPVGPTQLGPVSSANVTITDADPIPKLSILGGQNTDSNNGSSPTLMRFVLRLSNPSVFPVSAQLSTLSGTARVDEDFVGTNLTVTFAPGETEKLIDIPIISDDLFESRETFQLQITDADGAVIAGRAAKGTITEAGSQPIKFFASKRYLGLITFSPEQAPKGLLQIYVTRSGAMTGTLQLGPKRFSFSGAPDRNGEFATTLSAGNQRIRLALRLPYPEADDRIIGMFDDGTDAYGFAITPVVPTLTGEDYRLTMVLRPEETGQAPSTMGSAPFTVQLRRTGIASFVGRGPGGQAVSMSTGLIGDSLPIFCPIPGTKEILTGVAVTSYASDELSGTATLWDSSGTVLNRSFSVYGNYHSGETKEILDWSNGTLRLSGGGLPEDLELPVTITGNQQIRGVDNSVGTLKISTVPKTGFFKGTVTEASTGNVRTIYGVVLPKAHSGEGLFVDQTETGTVTLAGATQAPE